MGLTNTNKLISMDRIDCSGSLKVTLALAASPDISSFSCCSRSFSILAFTVISSPSIICLKWQNLFPSKRRKHYST